MSVKRTLAVFLFICLMCCKLSGQVPDIVFDKVHFEQGPFPQSISKMVQDQYGFLWIASDNGLDRFDGYKFQNYRYSDRDKQSLSCNIVGHLFIDSYGELWAGTVEGLNKFDFKTERFMRYFHDAKNPSSIADNLISPIYEDKQRNLWIGTYGGLCKYNRSKNNFTVYSHSDKNPFSLSHNIVSAIYQDKDGTFWIGTWGGGLDRFDPQTGKFSHYLPNPANPESISFGLISFIHQDKAGNYWVGTRGGGLNGFDPETGKFTHYKSNPLDKNSLSDNTLTTVFEDAAGNLWIGTWNGGLNIFDTHTKKFVSYRYSPDDPYSLISDCITIIYKDISGVIFIGTNKGMVKVRSKKSTFDFSTYKAGKANESLNTKDVRCIYQDDDKNLWIGTHEGGLNKLDRKTGKYTYYTFHCPDAPLKSQIEISAIADNHDGTLWLGSIGHGLFKFNKNGSYESLPEYTFAPNNNQLKDNVTYLYKDKKGFLWLGFPNGIVRKVNTRTGQVQNILVDAGIRSLAFLNEVNYFTEDEQGNIWVAIRHRGVYRIDAKSQQIKYIFASKNTPTTLNDNDVFTLHFAENGLLWIGTMNGLLRYNVKDESFKHYLISDGLPDNAVRSINEDRKGNLWMGTHKGLSRFDPITERFTNYDERDGVWITQFNTNSFYDDKTGEMFLCGYNGYIRFVPDHIDVNSPMPRVHITGLSIHDKAVNVGEEVLGSVIINQSILNTDKIELSYKQNNFSVQFTSLHYKMPDKNQYAYMLENYDKTWHYSGNIREVKYMNLAPGTYIFKVQGSNSDGIWNESGDSLKIVVYPPWWKSWWMFVILSFSFISIFIFYIYQRNLKHARDKIKLQQLVDERTAEVAAQNRVLAHQAEQLKEMSLMRSRFYTYLSHEFRTPITMIMGPVQQLLSGTFSGNVNEQLKIVMRNSKKLLHLIDELLDLSKIEKGSMSLKAGFTNIVPFLNRVVLSFSSLAERKHIKLNFEKPDNGITCYFDRDKLEKVIYNLLSNAFKYTPENGEITLCVSAESPSANYPEGKVVIKVKDNGAGIEKERLPHIFEQFYQGQSADKADKKGWGVGLALVKELVGLHRGEIAVESTQSLGTIFTFWIPLGQAHLTKAEINHHQVDDEDDKSETGYNLPEIQEAVEVLEGEIRAAQESIPATSDAGKKYTVLIVEDNADIRNYVRQILQKEYKILEAENGLEGCEKALATRTDLIVSDIMMPVMDGYELCRKIKTDFNTCHIPVILLTAKTSDIEKIEGLEKGADDYLTKPFNPVELKKRIENLIELRQQLQRKYRQDILLNPAQVEVKSVDERFLEKVKAIIDHNLSSPELSVEKLYTDMGMGRSNFHSKFRALTGQSANQFIRSYRLKRAQQLLAKNAGNISEIAFEVGFTSTAYFTKCYKAEFGKLPSEG
jgi:signal transduction histidine kinase/ligand-binding sensor domain-containing protein/CheY-like chemotaxis protein/AraC-like DNA-binding protein